MVRKLTKSALTPQQIMEDLTGDWRSRTLSAGIELDVFSHIAGGKRTAKEIAGAAAASQRGITNLLDALTGMNYLNKSGGRYSLRPVAAQFLVRAGKSYLGPMAQAIGLTAEMWTHLPEAVKSGRPCRAIDVTEAGKEFFPKLVAGIFPLSYGASRAAVSILPEKQRRKIRRILDVAAGSGAWSLAFAQAIPEAHVTAMDLPEVTPITRDFAEKFGVARRYEYLEGDMRKVDFGRDVYDLVILGHIIHSEGETHGKKLIAKCHAALRTGGLLLIAEYIPNDARSGPAIPLLFGVNMLLNTEEGNVFTMREYRAWLAAAGFRKVSIMPVTGPSPLILATK